MKRKEQKKKRKEKEKKRKRKEKKERKKHKKSYEASGLFANHNACLSVVSSSKKKIKRTLKLKMNC